MPTVPPDHARFLAHEAPGLIGVLAVCGVPPAEAGRLVDDVVLRAVAGGEIGGTELASVLTGEVLARATPPEPLPEPAGPVEHALRTWIFDDRLATVLAALGRPAPRGDARVADLAAALGAPADPWQATDDRPDVGTLVRLAVRDRTPLPDPLAVDRLEAALGRRRRRAWLIAAAAVVVGLVAVALVLLLARGDDDETRAPSGMLQWVAVLEVGEDAAALAPQARTIGEIVGPNVFTDRFGCYVGFPDDTGIGDDEWFLAIADLDRAVVEDLVARVGRPVLVLARVDQGCSLPPPDARALGTGERVD